MAQNYKRSSSGIVHLGLAIAVQLLLATIAWAQSYTDATTGLQWKLLTYPITATSTKVQSVYSQNMRPATYSELRALATANNGSIASMVSALGGDTGTVYNETAGRWLTATLASNSTPSAMFNSSVDTYGAVFAVARVCDTTKGMGVNIVDVYPDMTITGGDRTIDVCMCHSQRSGPTCSVMTTAANCLNSSTTNMDANTGQQILGGGLVDGTTESVVFNISSPQVNKRNITSFNWVTCDNNGTVQGGLTKYNTDTAQSGCNDVYTFGYRVSDLSTKCGLGRAIDPPGHTGFVRYRGDFIIYYREWATTAQNQTLLRTGRLVTPIDVFINRTYSAELKTNTSIEIYSPFEVQAAIVATQVKANSTTSYMDITIAVKAPYVIVELNSGNPLPHVSNNPSQTPDVAWACILAGRDTNSPYCTAKATWSNGSGLSDCVTGTQSNITTVGR